MLDTIIQVPKYSTASKAKKKILVRQWLWLGLIVGTTAYIAYTLVQEALTDSYYNNVSGRSAAWLVLLSMVGATIYQPRYGVYTIIFFALIGDTRISWWLPFTKNFSSQESLLFLNDSLSFSPQEIFILLTAVVWIMQMLIRREYKIYTTGLFWPVIVFTIFVVFGLVYGIGTGGNIQIALWESRAIFYLTAMFVLSSNLFTERRHYNVVAWLIMIALFIEGNLGIWYTFFWEQLDLSEVDSLVEHSAAQHMNTLFVFILASWLYKNVSYRKRLILPLLSLPVVVTYIISERRAAFLTLGVSILILTFFFYHERRTLFWYIMPPLAVIGIAYIGIFWNSSGALAFPVQAIKSVVAEDESNAADQASNEYRDIENLNSEFTIKARPFTGVGFGQKFYIVYQMPDISFFEWWEYITHNSIIWFWMKTGMFGFISMIYLVGLSIMMGARASWRIQEGNLKAICTTFTLYLMMHFIFAYVDMSWTDQSMLYIGLCMGVVSSIESVISKPLPTPQKRWPWQPETTLNSAIRPLPVDAE